MVDIAPSRVRFELQAPPNTVSLYLHISSYFRVNVFRAYGSYKIIVSAPTLHLPALHLFELMRFAASQHYCLHNPLAAVGDLNQLIQGHMIRMRR